ncbi:MAG: AMP-binding protein [Flavobacteriales bacterium]|nr:AMP-binding protein [Flavobacteriales bacterium]
MNIVNHFFEAAKQHPLATAMVEKQRVLSFSDMQKQVEQTAFSLSKKGIKSNQNILVMMPVGIDLYVHILAIFQIGARVVLVDQIFPKKGVLYAFKKAECTAIVTNHFLSVFRLFFFSSGLFGNVFSIKKNPERLKQISQKTRDDEALITFTSGSTGNAKAANRTHGFLDIQLQTIIQKTGLSPGDCHLTSFPVVTMCNLAVGATSVMFAKRLNLKDRQLIKNHFCPNIVSASVEYFNQFSAIIDHSKLKKLVVGGSTLLPHLVAKCTAKFDPKKTELVYGSTEAEPIATLTAAKYFDIYSTEEKGIPVGVKHPNIEVKIIQPNTDKVIECSESYIGEIIVSGNHVLKTYYKDENAYRENKMEWQQTIWHRTGDAGYIKHGILYFFGRMKWCWQENGEWFSPVTCEKFCSENNLALEATWLRIENENMLFYSGKKAAKNDLLQSFPHTVSKIISLKKLPKDKRHASRIDYEKLIGLGLK